MRIDYLANHAVHLETIAEWQHAEFGYLNPRATLNDRRSRLEDALQTERLPISLVALDGVELVGSANLLAKTLTHQHLSPWLSSVYVSPACRGRGIASELSLRIVAEAKRLGFAAVYLFTPTSEALYARLGWKTFDHIQHNQTALTIMELAL